MLKSALDNFLDARATRSCLPRSVTRPHLPVRLSTTPSCTHESSTMSESDKKPEPKELSDEYILAAIAKESKEFDKV
jgi:hypothetical protein